MTQTERVTCPDARNRVRSVLQPLCEKLPAHQADQLCQDACLVTSELITNAMVHGDGVSDFHTYVDDKVLTVGVSDHSTALPHTPLRAPEQTGGFGWTIVRLLSTQVDVAPGEGGKTITVTLEAAQPPAA
ncbi:ATP-binding protein [Streptomyces sp. BH055]|uniref:ATP-binding protein n=1 Tax=Streptomyces sp. BH055 TaxID=3401173 RepID=UPI003BB5B550